MNHSVKFFGMAFLGRTGQSISDEQVQEAMDQVGIFSPFDCKPGDDEWFIAMTVACEMTGYDQQAGSLFVDGVKVAEIPLELRKANALGFLFTKKKAPAKKKTKAKGTRKK